MAAQPVVTEQFAVQLIGQLKQAILKERDEEFNHKPIQVLIDVAIEKLARSDMIEIEHRKFWEKMTQKSCPTARLIMKLIDLDKAKSASVSSSDGIAESGPARKRARAGM